MTVHEPDPPSRHPDGSFADGTRRAQRSDHSPWNWLLVLPLVVTLFPPIYNKVDPTLTDIPFFYWYQMAAIAFSVAITLVVYSKTRS